MTFEIGEQEMIGKQTSGTSGGGREGANYNCRRRKEERQDDRSGAGVGKGGARVEVGGRIGGSRSDKQGGSTKEQVGSRRGKGGAGPIIGRKERKQAPAKTQLLPQFSTRSPGRYEDDEICEIIMNNVCDVDNVPVWKNNFFETTRQQDVQKSANVQKN